jgi:SAM-dependent methyltransferase
MVFDHSTTYRDGRIRNLPHRRRLQTLMRECDQIYRDGAGKAYADFGCSSGYVTHLIVERYRFGVARGFEYNAENLARAQAEFNSVKFSRLNLTVDTLTEKFDFASCFETLEHVGDYRQAVKLMHSTLNPGGVLLLTVPIEIGVKGMAKYLCKIAIGYDLAELTDVRWARLRYFGAVLTGRIAQFRPEGRTGWGTHFGFDYRVLDAAIRDLGLNAQMFNRGTTRFYVIRR